MIFLRGRLEYESINFRFSVVDRVSEGRRSPAQRVGGGGSVPRNKFENPRRSKEVADNNLAIDAIILLLDVRQRTTRHVQSTTSKKKIRYRLNLLRWTKLQHFLSFKYI